MKNFLINEKKMFLNFIYESKLLLGVTLFFVIFCYGIKIFYYDFSIDTDVILNNYGVQMSAWESIDRIGLVFTKKILFLDRFNPFAANFLTYFTLIVVCILLCYLVQRILSIRTEKIGIIIIPVIFLTNPIFAEQFNFILQSFEVVLAILFTVISLILIIYYLKTGNKIFALISILLSTWGFLTYQSLLLFFIAGSIASFILILNNHQRENQVKEFKEYFFIILKYILIFLISYALSKVFVYINGKITGIQSTAYLSRQILWGKVPFHQIYQNIKDQIYTVVFAKSIFYNYSFLVSAIIVFLILLIKLFLKNKSIILEILSFALLFISPFLLTIFMGQSEVIRAQMPAMQFVIAFCFYYIYLHLNNKVLKSLLVIFCLIIAFYQSNITANFLFSEHAKYEEDVTLANRINSQLDNMGVGDRKNYSLMILGRHNPESVLDIQGEALGHSLFEWDSGTRPGSTYRVVDLMRTLGYPFKMPTEQQINYAHSIKNTMDIWPKKNSIRIKGHLIIIKLSNMP